MIEEVKSVLLKEMYKTLYLLSAVLYLSTCSGNPPTINEVEFQLNLIDNKENGELYESLSFFFHAEDEDGEEDFKELYLINDDDFTVWEIPSEQWLNYEDQNINWIGFNGLRASGEGHFTEGNYRVLLIDLGGDRDEYPFFLRNRIPEDKESVLPLISYTKEYIEIKSDFPKFEIWFYDRDDNLLEKSQEIVSGSYQWNQISRNILRRTYSFSVYSEPENGSWGVVSGPFGFDD